MNRILTTFRNMSYAKKIQFIFGIVMLVPVSILVIFTLYSSVDYIRKQQYAEFKGLVDANIISIETEMEQCDRALNYIAANYSLQEYLAIPADDYIRKNEQSQVAGTLIYNTLLSNQSFRKIQVYSVYESTRLSDLIYSLNEIEDEDWYIRTKGKDRPVWQCVDDEIIVSKELVSAYPGKSIGIVRVEIVDDFFLQEFAHFQNEKINIRVVDGEGKLITQFNKGMSFEHSWMIEREVGAGGWKIIYEMGIDNIVQAYASELIVPGLFGIAAFCITWILIVLATNHMLKQMEQLVAEIAYIRNGDLDIDITVESQDEVGQIAMAIKDMLERIRMLIGQIYREERAKREMELELLRSKINPHFLYNNLSAINWIAIENGENRIYEISTGLASFYRTALNHGKNIDKMEVEFENVRAYLKLQLCAHENSFAVVVNEPEETAEWICPIFIVQPLIENAIEHGIDQMEQGKGKIEVAALLMDGHIVIEVRDNAKELYERIGAQKFPVEQYGYGLRNVDQRIKLICGDTCGVTLKADAEGTIARIVLDEEMIKNAIRNEM